MKKGLALLALAVLVASAYLAITPPPKAAAEMIQGSYYNTIVYDAAGTASTVVYGTPFRADRTTQKTIAFYGYSSTTSNVPLTGAMSGTATLQCDATNTGNGPFVPVKDSTANVVSATANTSFDLDTTCKWFRVTWNKTGSANQKLRAYILYHD